MEQDSSNSAMESAGSGVPFFPEAPAEDDPPFLLPRMGFPLDRTDPLAKIRGIMKDTVQYLQETIVDGAQKTGNVIQSSQMNLCYIENREIRRCQFGTLVEYLVYQLEPSGSLRWLEVRVAIKQLDMNKIREKKGSDDPIKEIRTLHLLSMPGHNNLIQLRECLGDKKQLYIILDYAPVELLPIPEFGDEGRTVRMVGRLFYQLVSGLKYIHDNGFAHMDLSVENILIAGDHEFGILKIIDFGVSRKKEKSIPAGTLIGKDYCMPPEMLSSTRGTFSYIAPVKVDMWDLGVVLYMMLFSGDRPFFHANDKDANYLRHREGNFLPVLQEMFDGQECGDDIMALFRGLLEIDPSKRMSIKDVLENPWVQLFKPEV